MDFESQGHYSHPSGGYRRAFQRITATYDGHTHVYQFPQEEAQRAIRMVKLHVEEGQLHPYAGLMLCHLIKGSDDAE